MKRVLLLTIALALTGYAYSQSLFASEENIMNDDERLRLTFSTLWGITTYVGDNAEVLSQLDNFTNNDISLVKRSANDYSYTREARKILSDLCDYYDATPRESLDVEYLARAPLQSHDIEVSSKKQFLRNLYGELSIKGKSYFDQRMKDIHLTASTGNSYTYREEPDFTKPVMVNAIIDATGRTCVRIRENNERMERNNYIEDPEMTTIQVNLKKRS